MTTLEQFLDFSNRLTASLLERQNVLGLVLVGSTADTSRVDEWSDHDFFVVTEPGSAESLRQDLSWLPDHEQIIMSPRETDHGLKVVYQNSHVLERYLAAYIEGCRASLDPAQRGVALQVLMRELKLTQQVAELTYAELIRPGSGIAKDCAFDMAGFNNVLALRAEMEGQWGGKAPDAAKFIDMGLYKRALGHASR